MKAIFVTILLTLTSISAMAEKDRGGGDEYALAFIKVGESTLPWMKRNQSVTGVNAVAFENALNETTVQSTENPLEIDGVLKDAINYPSQKLIVFNRNSWDSPSTQGILCQLVVHEYLGIMGVDDTNYRISRLVDIANHRRPHPPKPPRPRPHPHPGTPAAVTVSDGPTYGFGVQSVGSSTDHTFVLTNGGSNSAINISGDVGSAPFGFKGGTYPGTGGTCAATLAAAGTCTVVVTYAPTVAGASSSTLSIAYNDGANAQNATRAIQGTGEVPAMLSISDGATFDFGTVKVGSAVSATFTVTNSGGFPAYGMSGKLGTREFTFAGGAYPGTGGTCATQLAPAATCTVIVMFAPRSAVVANATLDLRYNDGTAAQSSTRPMTGMGR